MAIKDCIRKLEKSGHRVTDKMKRDLAEAIADGLTDEQAVRRAVLMAEQKVIDIVGMARDGGATVAPAANPVTELAQYQARALEKISDKQEEVNAKMTVETDRLNDITLVMGYISTTDIGDRKGTDLTDDQQVMDVLLKMQFNPDLQANREAFGLVGKSANEMFDSFRKMRDERVEVEERIGKLKKELDRLQEQVETVFHGKEQKYYQIEAEKPRLTVRHNLSPEKLVFTDNLGGLAVPSLAITNEGAPYTGFGSITLIGNEDLGDPAKLPIFDADGYTVRFPSPEYKSAAAGDLDPLIRQIVAMEQAWEPQGSVSYLVDRHLRDHPNPQTAIWTMQESTAIKAWFLMEKHGEQLTPKERDVKPSIRWAWDDELVKFFEENPSPEKYQWDSEEHYELMKRAGDIVRKVGIRSLMKRDRKIRYTKEEAERIFDQGAFLNADGTLANFRFRELANDAKNKGKKEIDQLPTVDMINARMDIGVRRSEFKAWIESMIVPMLGDPRLKLGNKYVEYNLENIVRKMKGKLRGTEFMDGMLNEGMMRALAAHRFKRLEEMRVRSQTQIADPADVQPLRDAAKAAMDIWTQEMAQFYLPQNANGYVDHYEAADSARRAVVEWATRSGDMPTANDLEDALARNGFDLTTDFSVPDWLVDQGMMAAMDWLAVPVPYFEGKPQRAVDLNEFSGAVIPSDSPPEVRAILQKHGIRYKEYQVEKLTPAMLADDFVGPHLDEHFMRTSAVEEFTEQLNNQGERTLFQSEIGFTSGLLTAARVMPQEKGSAEQMMATLKKMPNVKRAELEWLGVEEFAQAMGTVTRQQLVDYIKENGIQVKETVYAGERPKTPDIDVQFDSKDEFGVIKYTVTDGDDIFSPVYEIFEDKDAGNVYAVDPEGNYLEIDSPINNQRRIHAEGAIAKDLYKRRIPEGAKDHAKWATYTLPEPPRGAFGDQGGGLNHREIVLHLPEVLMEQYTDENVVKISYSDMDPSAPMQRMNEQDDQFWFFQVPGNTLQISKYSYPSVEDAKKYIIEEKQPGLEPGKNYRSHAYPEQNIMAWVRATDRMGPNGESILFIEEVQSDLHQEGQKVGYGLDPNGPWSAGPTVPDMPFKGDLWGELAMKRMIRLASEEGYDQVAWTTGTQQMERWSFEEYFSRVTWDPRDEQLATYDLNDRLIETQHYVLGDLEPVIGAERVLEIKRQIDDARRRYEVVPITTSDVIERGSNALQVELDDPFIGPIEREWLKNDGEIYGLMDENGEMVRQSSGNYQAWEYFDGAEEGLDDFAFGANIPTLTGQIPGEGAGMKQFYDKLLVNVTNRALKKLDKSVKVKRAGIQMEGGGVVQDHRVEREGGGALVGEIVDPGAFYVSGRDWDVNKNDPKSRIQISPRFDTYAEALQWSDNITMGYANTVHGFDISGDVIARAMEGQTYMQDGNRGSITFDDQNKAIIRLTQAKDLSTFLHETAHLYLEMMADMAEMPNAPKNVIDDFATTLKYLGINSRREIATKHHELFARSWEAYLREGRAPVPELQDLYTRIGGWLVRVYDIITKLMGVGEDLTPEIRGVFDRLVAGDRAISQSEDMMAYTQLFQTAEEMGVSQEVFDVYKRGIQEAHDDAMATESKKMIKAMKWSQEQWWKDALKKVQAEVRAEAEQMPVYKALFFLQRGKQPNGKPAVGQPFKLTKESVLAAFDGVQATVNKLPRPHIYTVKDGGVDADVAAVRFGFANGKEMLAAIRNAPNMEEFIRDEAKMRMEQLHPDPMNSPEMVDDAVRAVHSEKRGKILKAELDALRKQQGADKDIVKATKAEAKRQDKEALEANRGMMPNRENVAAIKASATLLIAKKKIRDLKPHNYLNAERKAGRLAFEAMARKDYEEAYRQKLIQIMNFHAYKAAAKAKDQATRDRNYFNTFSKQSKRQRMGKAGVLEQIDQILENIQLKTMSETKMDRVTIENELIEGMKDGSLVIPPEILQSMTHPNGINWRDLTVEELSGIRDVLKQLEHKARTDLKAIINGEEVIIAEKVDELAESLIVNNEKEPVLLGDLRPRKQVQRNVREVVGHWLRSSSIARVLDKSGFGAFTRNIIVPIRRAYTEKLVPRTMEMQKALTDIYQKHYSNDELAQLNKELDEPLLDGHIDTHGQALALALNWGTESNRRAVLGGIIKDEYGNETQAYTEQGVAKVLSTLTAKDWAFVQDVWDYEDTFYDEMAETERRRRGIAPKKVEALPFEIRTADGQMLKIKGGYHPLKYEHRHGRRVTQEEFVDFFNKVTNGSYLSAGTRAGSTYERTKNHGKVVRLTLGTIDTNLRELIRDLTIGDEVNLVNKLLQSEKVENAANNTGKYELLQELRLWLTDAAVGELPAQNTIEKSLSYLRVGFTKSKLAFNIFVTALQITGFAQSIAVAGWSTMGKGMGKFLRDPVGNYKWVMEKSRFMNVRYGEMQQFDKDVADTQNFLKSIFGPVPTKFKTSMDAMGKWYFWPIAKAQSLVDVITWMGSYEKALNDPNISSEQDAVFAADATVENAQTSGLFSDRSGIERGTLGTRTRQGQFVRLWTVLISYMLAKGNIAYEKGVNTNFRDPKSVAYFAADMLMLFMVEGILSSLLYGNKPEWDDDDEKAKAIAGWTAQVTWDSMTAGIPLVREYNAARYGSGNTPVGSIFNDGFEFMSQVSQGELDEPLVKSGVKTFGTLFHLPASQFNRGIDALFKEDDAEVWEYILGASKDED